MRGVDPHGLLTAVNGQVHSPYGHHGVPIQRLTTLHIGNNAEP